MWTAMEEQVKKGFVRAIGISNFTITQTELLLKNATVIPAVNQGVCVFVCVCVRACVRACVCVDMYTYVCLIIGSVLQ